MPGFAVFTVIDQAGTVQKAFPLDRITSFTLNNGENYLWIKGRNKPLRVANNGQEIARATGIWRPTQLMLLTDAKTGNDQYVPVQLLGNSSYYAEGGKTHIVAPDGQQFRVKEGVDELANRLASFDIFLERKAPESANDQPFIF